jgi:hypothetical protein
MNVLCSAFDDLEVRSAAEPNALQGRVVKLSNSAMTIRYCKPARVR